MDVIEAALRWGHANGFKVDALWVVVFPNNESRKGTLETLQGGNYLLRSAQNRYIFNADKVLYCIPA